MTTVGDNIRVHLRIEGRVQGVFFRTSTQEQASRLGLRGWVRNCPDGSVEVMAQGAKKSVEALVAWCRQGPRGARVQGVLVEWEEPGEALSGFRITG